MTFGSDVLLEIVDIVRDGIVNGRDMSERLREIDLVLEDEILHLSDEYLRVSRGGEKN